MTMIASISESIRSNQEEILLLQYCYKKLRGKPLGLGSTDLELTPRSMAVANKPPKKPIRFTAADLVMNKHVLLFTSV